MGRGDARAAFVSLDEQSGEFHVQVAGVLAVSGFALPDLAQSFGLYADCCGVGDRVIEVAAGAGVLSGGFLDAVEGGGLFAAVGSGVVEGHGGYLPEVLTTYSSLVRVRRNTRWRRHWTVPGS
jgi:hypothetical protein